MKKNVGLIDGLIRIIVGAGITSMAFVGPSNPLALIGLVPILTGIIGWCPPYALLGVSTCGKAGSCCGN